MINYSFHKVLLIFQTLYYVFIYIFFNNIYLQSNKLYHCTFLNQSVNYVFIKFGALLDINNRRIC